MLIGAIALPAQAANVALDIVLSAALLAWATATLSKSSVMAIIVFEVLSLVVNIYAAVMIGQWGDQMAALVVHIGFRIGILVFAGLGLANGLRSAQENIDEVDEVFS